ncbi:MAG: type II secretion system protein [Christensenellaceae bacterium]
MGLKKRAFTLVELVIVIAIIAVLMAILIPSMLSISSEAELRVCESNRATVLRIYKTYAMQKKPPTLKEIVANANQDYFSNEVKCPSKGVYSVVIEGNNEAIHCSIHGNSSFHGLKDGDIPDGIKLNSWNNQTGNWKVVNGRIVSKTGAFLMYKVDASEYTVHAEGYLKENTGMIVEGYADGSAYYGTAVQFEKDGKILITPFKKDPGMSNLDGGYQKSFSLPPGMTLNKDMKMEVKVRYNNAGQKVVDVLLDGVVVVDGCKIKDAPGDECLYGVRTWGKGTDGNFSDLYVTK